MQVRHALGSPARPRGWLGGAMTERAAATLPRRRSAIRPSWSSHSASNRRRVRDSFIGAGLHEDMLGSPRRGLSGGGAFIVSSPSIPWFDGQVCGRSAVWVSLWGRGADAYLARSRISGIQSPSQARPRTSNSDPDTMRPFLARRGVRHERRARTISISHYDASSRPGWHKLNNGTPARSTLR